MFRRTLLFFAVSMLVFASDPDFTGRWRLNPARSDRDRLPEPAMVLLNIEHHGNEIRCTGAPASSIPPFTWSFTTDRKESRYRVGDTVRNTVVKWEGDCLLINTIVNGRNASYTVMDRWKMPRDGHTLRIERTVETLNGENFRLLVYDREP